MAREKAPALVPRTESNLARGYVVEVALANGELYRFNLHDVTWIDLEDLDGEVQGQAQRYAFYGTLHVGVKAELRTARTALDEYFVENARAVRDGLTSKATETEIKQAVKGQAGYRALQERVDHLEELEDRVGVVREALTQRRDMLQSACMLRAPERAAGAGERAARGYRPRT